MKLIVFDLDGTLLNTLQDLTDSVNFAMDGLGLNRYTTEQVRLMVGNGVAKLMERAVTEANICLKDKALSLQRQYYTEHNGDNTFPYAGVEDMLRSLKRLGYVIAVHTNKDESAAQTLCKTFFKGLIDYVCGTTDDGLTKPNPEKIRRLTESLCVKITDVVYCGDSDVDIATANNLGAECISVTWGFRNVKFLQNCGAKHLVSAPEEVVKTALGL